MWFSTPSVESITRPRVAVALVSAFAAASASYYLHQQSHYAQVELPGAGLHRRNAVRRNRRSQRHETESSSESDVAGDENIDISPLHDGETDVGDGAEEWDALGQLQPNQRAGHNIVNLLFRVSEDNARRTGCVHRGCQCNSCGMVPIRGIRYRCVNCDDFDLCETCESQGMHIKTHIFYKIRVPASSLGPKKMQPVWYTGDPDMRRKTLPKNLIATLSRETGFERPELEAFWEQWTFMANTEWRDDPDGLELAMDRKTFERCLISSGVSQYAAPNLIHDRMFAFYDYNNDGLIGFSEFLRALSYRKRRDKLRKVFEGYDIDGDGYVSRRDFLRMFRAYYVLYKEMHKNILDGLQDQLLASTEAQQLIASRQPLSSLFGREGRVPHGERTLRLDGKQLRTDGSVEIEPGFDPIAPNGGDTASRQDILTSLFAVDSTPRERNRWRIIASTGNNPDGTQTFRDVDADRPYLVTLMDPPLTLDDLPDAIMAGHTLEIEDMDEDDKDDSDSEVAPEPEVEGLRYPTETEERIKALSYNRRRIPQLEKRKRDMARDQLHDRWKRRQFYLDEEEGGEAPWDWEDNEDIFLEHEHARNNPKTTETLDTMSWADSKVHYADREDPDATSSPSTSSTSIPDRWSEPDVPQQEQDAGKEILYQITQQAFNELLDNIFKTAESNAVEARETRQQREEYKKEIEEYAARKLTAGNQEDATEIDSDVKDLVADPEPRGEKALTKLLETSGYTVYRDPEPECRNACDLGNVARDEVKSASAAIADPTMPQNMPSTLTWADFYKQTHGIQKVYPVTCKIQEEKPTDEQLDKWLKLNETEQQALARGGWGRLNYAEFEEIYRSQEQKGNRLDYVGSWIDFSIP
ncbi:E3 ubiquitin-protein ligase-like protein [Emericellopsis cladophorae]|uniref:E3 ubiquitin-protein ligase-like protein n=1 Tax=Emericellopsis cladophorae TaxID=2686198 RepID=A0A9P9Y2F9_9HYPO|nr:E3 ubiquitin-protein ligase-like protein [Emericellopsis cladophorae]KAI6782289.1 E3 ubiquitin-protein ligase-like protein [Emericellopsis cladophorae]